MYTHKILQKINTKQTQLFYKNTDMCLFYRKLLFCLLQFVNYFTFVTDSDWSSKQPVSDFSPTVHFNKKAQLSVTNPRDGKVCQKLLQFDVLTTLSLTILASLHSFSCCCGRNLRNPGKFTENSNLWSSRSSKFIDLGASRKPICDFILVVNSNFSRICYRSQDICG